MNARIVHSSVRNLIGVNNEKEPLSGTTPDRWLLDKSLHFDAQIENNILALHTNVKDEINFKFRDK